MEVPSHSDIKLIPFSLAAAELPKGFKDSRIVKNYRALVEIKLQIPQRGTDLMSGNCYSLQELSLEYDPLGCV